MGTTAGHKAASVPATHLPAWVPATEQERAAVREQLERILNSPCFRNSRKYPAFLRYIVEHTLTGEADRLKERTLGIEVFGRNPEYDTSSDPVVRIVAAEVRKRIGQYYHEFASPGEIVLDLAPGSYVPRFSLPTAGAVPELRPAEPFVGHPEEPTHFDKVPAKSRRRFGLSLWQLATVAIVGVTILIAALAMKLSAPQQTALEEFWQPLLDSAGMVLVVTGGGAAWMPQLSEAQGPGSPAPAMLSVAEQQARDVVAFADTNAVAAIAGNLRSHNKPFLIRPSRLIDLPQLRNSPAVLIGALNNPWTLRLTAGLRFSFHRDDATQTNWIEDKKNPGARSWKVNMGAPYGSIAEDWAVISRFKDPNTRNWIVTVSGLCRWGTMAAGEFLTDAGSLRSLAQVAPAGWVRKNLQVLISTKVINGQAGPPQILAAEFW